MTHISLSSLEEEEENILNCSEAYQLREECPAEILKHRNS